MSDLRQAAQQALEALLWADAQGENWQQVVKKAIKPIQEAAAQPEPVQEPFGYLWPTGSHPEFRFTQQKRDGADGMPLYTTSPQQQAEPVAQRSDGMPISKTERELRRMLCLERHSRSAYMDDGEASFCGDKYCRSIDYMRESVESIKQAWYDAGVKKLAGAQPEQQAEPVQGKPIDVDALGIPHGQQFQPAQKQQAEPVADEWAKLLHYPDCWDTAAYPTLHDAIHESLAWSECSVCKLEQQAEPVAWLVCSVNGDGSLSLEHAAAWEEAAHEHINDAITEHSIEDAAAWVVRPAYTTSPQQQAEPVAYVSKPTLDRIKDFDGTIYANGGFDDALPLYTTPPQRKPLTDEQVRAALGLECLPGAAVMRDVRRIETAHGIKEGT